MMDRASPTPAGLSPTEVLVMVLGSAILVLVSHQQWAPLGMTEVLGFVTGGVCVWLTVREHVWNWPIGLANTVVFFVLFLRSRLFADMALQMVYFALGVYGWLNWLHGGKNHSALKISRATSTEWILLALFIIVGTWGLRILLLAVNGAAPFWDALTTTISLAAQYLLCRKRMENWFFWIAADVIYIPLYLSRQLPLTALLYAVFLTMCLLGVREWSRSLVSIPAPVEAKPA